MRTAKIIIIILMLTFTVIFFMENMDPVALYIPILRGCKVGLVFIMFGSYFLGTVTTLGIITLVGSKIRKRRRLQELSEDQKELFDEE
jgi:uncharacterized integral membrane protein